MYHFDDYQKKCHIILAFNGVLKHVLQLCLKLYIQFASFSPCTFWEQIMNANPAMVSWPKILKYIDLWNFKA